MDSLLVFSHLRWDFVYQRPQHLMQRLARSYRVFFFEEPVANSSRTYLSKSQPIENLIVCRPHTHIEHPGFHDDQIPVLSQLVEELVAEEHLDNYGVWFYSPMALPLMKQLQPKAVVYDCMDELSAFRNAPKQLLQRESALLKVADVVFTGGPSLYKSKRERHSNVHCFPSSVDAAHFSQAQDPAIDHPLQRELPHPRIGFFGVIDERIDLQMLGEAAKARPDWQFIMVGPHVKIDPASMPRPQNIHYFGQQAYADLPKFVAGWDVCMQPFALNEATRFISPTKTLEYMAAERPIVSTPITDVVEPYGNIVHIARDAQAFVESCERALSAQPSERDTRRDAMRSVIANTSWDRTAEAMKQRLEEAQRGSFRSDDNKRKLTNDTKGTASVSNPANSSGETPLQAARLPSRENAKVYSTIVIGAGPTGLSAGYHLGKGSLVLEQNPTVGGWCRSIEDKGFTFDYAGHIMFSNDPYVHSMYKKLLGDNVHWQDREAWIYSKNVYTRYPFQGALYGLPPDVLKDCIVGAIEARYGKLKESSSKAEHNERPTAARSSSPSACKAESITDCCADGIAESTAPLSAPVRVARASNEPENFEDFIYRVWGAGVAKHFAIPYNRKLWAVPLNEMETSWLGGRVPLPDLEEMIDGALRPVAKPQGPNARFGYPLRGGFQALMNGFVPHMRGEVLTGAKVSRINLARRVVTLSDGQQFRYRQLISTAPLPALLAMMGEGVPSAVRAACATIAARLRALRESRDRPRECDGEALDLLSGRHGVSSYLCARQCKPALQRTGRIRTHLRNYLFALKTVAVRR
jgi:UDP-galactopyranose mutase